MLFPSIPQTRMTSLLVVMTFEQQNDRMLAGMLAQKGLSLPLSVLTALDVAQVNRHYRLYFFTFFSIALLYIRVMVNGDTSCTLTFGSGAHSGVAYGLPPCFHSGALVS